jgi:hypothetical protein
MFSRVSEIEIEAVMSETGMGRMQAINHIRQRTALRRKALNEKWLRDEAEFDGWHRQFTLVEMDEATL